MVPNPLLLLADARCMGRRLGLRAAAWSVLIVHLVNTLTMSLDTNWLNAFFWFIRFAYWPNVLIGVIILLASGYGYGQLVGKLILIDHWRGGPTGCLMAVISLLTTSFLASWTGFIQEGIDAIGSADDPYYNYLLKPMYWVVGSGLIPALLVGGWCGHQLKKKGQRLASMGEGDPMA